MGTWVAYELLAAARAAGLPAPRAAFLSAMPAPDLPPAARPWRAQRSLSEADFKARRTYQHRTALMRTASTLFLFLAVMLLQLAPAACSFHACLSAPDLPPAEQRPERAQRGPLEAGFQGAPQPTGMCL